MTRLLEWLYAHADEIAMFAVASVLMFMATMVVSAVYFFGAR